MGRMDLQSCCNSEESCRHLVGRARSPGGLLAVVHLSGWRLAIVCTYVGMYVVCGRYIHMYGMYYI